MKIHSIIHSLCSAARLFVFPAFFSLPHKLHCSRGYRAALVENHASFLFRFVSIPRPFGLLASALLRGRDDPRGQIYQPHRTHDTTPADLSVSRFRRISYFITHAGRDIVRIELLLSRRTEGFTHPPSNFDFCFTLRRRVESEDSRY